MSHFLARLVERARGTAPCVEPVVAPRFTAAPIFEVASEVETLPPGREQQPGIANQALSAEKPDPKRVSEPERLPLLRDYANDDHKTEKLLVPIPEHPTVVRPSQAANRALPLGKNGRRFLARSAAKRPRSAAPVSTTLQHLENGLVRPNESSEEPPIIRVTIGRIDVRATPPGAPSRKSPTRSEPKLTLDAYLKSRKEGIR